MSSISDVTSTTNSYETTNQSSLAQFIQDLNSIGTALQSGNVSAAQTALTTFQQDFTDNSQTSANQPFGRNSQANKDYQSMVSALNSGDVSDAQKAFANLQNDLKAVHKGHHHHHGPGLTSTTSTTTPTTTTDSAITSATSDSDADNHGSSLNVTA